MSRQYPNDYASGGGYPAQYGAGYTDPSGRMQSQPARPYDAYDASSVPSAAASSTYVASTLPPYSSQQHLVDPEAQSQRPPYTNQQNPRQGGGPSPFDSVFDDNVYPAGTYRGAAGVAGGSGAGAGNNNYGPGGSAASDTAYYPSRVPSDDNLNVAGADGIPLRDRNKSGVESPDHVYDIPQGGMASMGGGGGSKRKGVRFGELGMMGANRRRVPIVVYIFTLAQVAVFIGEIVKNALLTGSPIMIHPSFNPMIGPSTYVLINMGSRFVPCMHNVDGIQSSTVVISWPCPNTTTSNIDDPSNQCTLSQLCGFNGVPNPLYDGNADQTPEPNQWFRFIVPIFLHAGIIHIGFNMLLQLTMGRDMERAIGSIRFFLVYVSSGIFGFVMGGNYAATGISSTGASGSLFGIIALTLLDLFYSWNDRRNPTKDLLFIGLDVIISFVLGLLPGLDNFSHIGGFLMGLALGITVLHSPNALRRRIGEDSSYASVSGTYSDNIASSAFLRSPIAFFKGRKPLWWGWWLLRAGAIVIVVVVFILLLNNFYIYHNTCGWCKYLSCLPVNGWCETGNLKVTTTTTSAKRGLLSAATPLLAHVL